MWRPRLNSNYLIISKSCPPSPDFSWALKCFDDSGRVPNPLRGINQQEDMMSKIHWPSFWNGYWEGMRIAGPYAVVYLAGALTVYILT